MGLKIGGRPGATKRSGRTDQDWNRGVEGARTKTNPEDLRRRGSKRRINDKTEVGIKVRSKDRNRPTFGVKLDWNDDTQSSVSRSSIAPRGRTEGPVEDPVSDVDRA